MLKYFMQDSVSWKARWIASEICGGPNVSAPAPYFRTSFHIKDRVQSAWLHITALGLYEGEINGRLVTQDVFTPGWTEYKKRVPFQSYDVTGLLSEGENAIGVVLGDGWYAGRVGEKERGYYGDRPRFLAQLEIVLGDGSVQSVVSDTSWKTATGPILENDIMAGETYDARRELTGWSSAGFDDAGWKLATVMADPGIVVDRSPGLPVRRQEILPGHALEPRRSGDGIIFDFKQNLTGRVRFSIRGQRGTRVVLRHAEVLEKGAMYLENLRTARATDSYTLKGEGTETWEPRFTFHGFRFAELTWKEGPAPEIEKVEAVVLHSEMAETGTFRCSHELLNQLEHNIIWGQKGNFLEVPTDCPQRDERLGWTGDAQVFVRVAAFHRDVRRFFHKWLRDMRDAQEPTGAIPPVVPKTFSFGLSTDGGPAWADAAFICPWTVYRCYGDVEIVRNHYECMAGYLDFLAEHKVKDHIRAHPDRDEWGGFGDWLALDGTGKVEGGTPKDLIGTAHYANNVRIMVEAAELLGYGADLKKYRALYAEIVEAFRRRFITPDGLVAGGTQTAYVLALHFDLVPAAVRANAARELVRAIERNGNHLATGFVGTPYLLHVLEAQGHLDVAYRLLEQESFPSWLFPVKNGATTIWERWDGWTPEKGFQDKAMNSFNHYAYGAVGDWMVSTVAGLEIGAPGYQKILFKPRPGGTITWAEATLQTPHGEAAIRWELKDALLNLLLTVPAGVEAELALPSGWKSDETKLGAGMHKVTATR